MKCVFELKGFVLKLGAQTAVLGQGHGIKHLMNNIEFQTWIKRLIFSEGDMFNNSTLNSRHVQVGKWIILQGRVTFYQRMRENLKCTHKGPHQKDCSIPITPPFFLQTGLFLALYPFLVKY